MVYLDNSATTRPSQAVRDAMVHSMEEVYFNPSALYGPAMQAEKELTAARKALADRLGVPAKNVIFTSGGTESDNLALMGAAHANRRAGRHLITTKIEHPAILNTMKELEKQGFQVTYLPVDDQGVVRIADLEAALTDETILVSVMYVNNEIGAVQPIEEIGKLLKNREKPILFHVDAVQGYGKFRILPKKLGVDMLSVSGHKIHGPKGMGILYVDEHVKIHPILFGGGQQRDLRSGTENVPGIAGLGEAVKEIYTDFNEKIDRLYGLREYFIEEIGRIEGTSVNGPRGREGAPHIVSVSFAGVRSEVLLHSLEDKGIYVSSGSACASNHPAVSETLKAIHVKKELLDSTIRFSFSEFTTKEELDYTLEALRSLLPMLRRFTRR